MEIENGKSKDELMILWVVAHFSKTISKTKTIWKLGFRVKVIGS